MENNNEPLIIINKNANTEGEREILFVSKELAEIIKNLGEVEGTKAYIKKSYANLLDEIVADKEVINEATKNLIEFSNEVKKELAEVMDKEVEEMYEVWEKLNKKRSQTRDKTTELINSIKEVKNEIYNLQTEINKISVYGLEKIIDLVEKINNLNENDKELLGIMFNTYKK